MSRKGKGGPKTLAGKREVSKNALQHGLSARHPATQAEAQLGQELHQALVAHYVPSNPLEQLQVQRIARTAAKLAHLQVVEDTLIQQAVQRAAFPTMTTLQELDPHASSSQLNEAMSQLLGGRTAHAFGLSDEVLASLITEITKHLPMVHSSEDMTSLLPLTCAYLCANVLSNSTHDAAYKLWIVTKSLSVTTDASKTQDHTGFEDLLSQIGREKLHDTIVKSNKRPETSAKGLAEGIQHDLNRLLHEHANRQAVQRLVNRYKGAQARRLRGAMPPADQADRIMRYQTSLDRQLSRCIGEFLQMRQIPHGDREK